MHRILFMLTLVLAGELIFGLPFHTARFFRPTFLEVFGFSNTQLGDVFAVYGITAMLAYFPGGVIADHYSPRTLMTLSLFATAAGGLYMATFPEETQLAALYGFFGVSTVLLFWSAMISATREWGGDHSQGRAFGILDGGRGLVAAAFAVFAVAVLSAYMPADMSQDMQLINDTERRQGFRAVILLYSAATAFAGCLTWFVVPRSLGSGNTLVTPLVGMLAVLQRPIVWAQALVVVCAYCGFKGSDNYSLYAAQVLGMDEVAAARFTAYASYLRPVGALAAGIVADRISTSRVITIAFLVLVVSYSLLAVAIPTVAWTNIIFANLLISFFAVFALRGVYFALLQDAKTPKHLTGSTVGLISLVGYTPDIFFAPIGGRILDSASVLVGHQRYFMFLTGIAIVGVLSVIWLVYLNRRQEKCRVYFTHP